MQFSSDLRAGVLAGDITVSYRLWKHPQVKVGGRYALGDDVIQIDSIDLVPFRSVSAVDVRRSGEPDLESLRRRAAHSGPIADDTVLHRVTFHVVRSTRPAP